MSEVLDSVNRKLDYVISRLDAEKRWLGIDEAADVLGISRDSVKRMLKDGRLRGHKPVAGRVVIDRLELNRVIEAS